MNTVHLRILAPERTFFDGVCVSFIVPTIDGMYGVMAQHEDVMIAIVPGKLTLRGQDGDEQIAAVSEGLLKMENGKRCCWWTRSSGRRRSTCAAPRRWPPLRAPKLDARHSEQEQALARARIARAVSRMHVKRDGK